MFAFKRAHSSLTVDLPVKARIFYGETPGLKIEGPVGMRLDIARYKYPAVQLYRYFRKPKKENLKWKSCTFQ